MRDVDRGFTQINADEVKGFTVHPERAAVEGSDKESISLVLND